MSQASLIIILILVVLGLLILFLVWLRNFLIRRGLISRSLQLKLLKIQLPGEGQSTDEGGGIAQIREKIALMEQVFTQLSSIKNSGVKAFFQGPLFFTLELAVENQGKEISFYCAVPRQYLSGTEKAIQGVYPDVNIEESEDYSIFDPEGSAAAATLKTEDKYLPLKTFQSLESDPLGSVVNAFSKVNEQGEGVVLQLILRKAPGSVTKHLLDLQKHLQQGKSVSEARRDMKKSELKKTVEKKEEKLEQLKQITVNQNLLEQVGKKSLKTLFTSNIRLITSAATQERASALLQELSAPFSQFSNPEVNQFKVRALKGRNLQRAIYNYSFRLPSKESFSYLSTEELSSIFHFPNTTLGVAHISSSKAKFSPVPSNITKEGILLGINKYRGVDTEVRLGDKDRARHFYIIGQTGTGKSVFMQNLAIQDIQNGKGVCFIDPHGDAIEEILQHIPKERIEDVIYFNPGDVARPMGLNLLEYDPKFPEQKTFIINELLEIFNKLYDMKTAGGPMFEQYFRNATALVMDDPASGNTLLEINRVFVDKAFRDLKLSKTTNPLVKTFWKEIAEKAGGEASLQNIVPYISSKFDSFLSNEIMRPIVAQEKSAINLREIMDNEKILLINLSKGRLGEMNSSLIGLIMVGKILMSAFSRIDTPESQRKPFYLYIDEFQSVTTNSIETILSEARKYRLNLIVAHQFIDQLSDETKKSVFGNVGSMSAFRVGAEDGEFLEKQFGPTFTAKDLINIDNFHCYLKLLIDGQTAEPFSMNTIPPTKGNEVIAQKAIEYSRLAYGRDIELVNQEINLKF